MLMKAVLYICPNTSEKRGNVSSAGMLEETTDEPDDSLLYAVVRHKLSKYDNFNSMYEL